MSDPRDKSSDLYTDDPIIVFDQNEDDSEGNSQTPIGFGFRQPSFVRLHGVPIPKGFGSLADFKAEKLPVKVERKLYAMSFDQEISLLYWDHIPFLPIFGHFVGVITLLLIVRLDYCLLLA